MGCWNGTCLISNLPIFAGEDVKFIITERDPHFKLETLSGSAFCYSDTIFKPKFLQLDAEYNDYGSVENIKEDWNYNIVNSSLIKDDIIIKADREIFDKPNLYNLINGIERGSLEIFNTTKQVFEKSYLSFSMIRKDIWDHIILNYEGEYWKPDEERKYENDYYESGQIHLKRLFGYIKNYCNNLKKELLSQNQFYHYNLPNTYLDYFLFKDKNCLNDNEEDICKQYIEFYLMKSFMGVTRKSWNLVAGAGSQASSLDEYLLLAKGITEVCNKLEQEFGEDY